MMKPHQKFWVAKLAMPTIGYPTMCVSQSRFLPKNGFLGASKNSRGSMKESTNQQIILTIKAHNSGYPTM